MNIFYLALEQYFQDMLPIFPQSHAIHEQLPTRALRRASGVSPCQRADSAPSKLNPYNQPLICAHTAWVEIP